MSAVLNPLGQPIGNVYDPGNVQSQGAKGDDSTDDTDAILAAAAASRNLHFPGPAIYRLSEEIYYDSSSPVRVTCGPGAVIKTVGATNRAFHFDGQLGGLAGATSAKLVLENVWIEGANSGTADSAIFLDGVALFWLRNTVIFGGGKFTAGISGKGAQQGLIGGGYIQNVDNCIHLYESPSVEGVTGSNGVDIHGMSLNGIERHFLVEDTDSVMFHHNHMISTTAPVGVDVNDCQSGCRISNNHLEFGPEAIGIRVRGSNSQGVRLDGNVLLGDDTGIHIVAGSAITVDSNSFIQCGLTYDSGTSYIRTINNYAISSEATVFSDASTFGTRFGNQSAGSAFDFGNGQFTETLSLTDPRILVLATASLPAADAAQDGRVIIEDAGSGDRNIIVYAGGQRFRIDGGTAF